VLQFVELREKVSRSIGRFSVDSAAADCHNDAAAVGRVDENSVLGCSSIARARPRNSTARQGLPTSGSRSRCSTGRGHRQIRHSTPCR